MGRVGSSVPSYCRLDADVSNGVEMSGVVSNVVAMSCVGTEESEDTSSNPSASDEPVPVIHFGGLAERREDVRWIWAGSKLSSDVASSVSQLSVSVPVSEVSRTVSEEEAVKPPL